MTSRSIAKAGKHLTRLSKKRSKAQARKESLKDSIPASKPHPPHLAYKLPAGIKDLIDQFGAEELPVSQISPESAMFAVSPCLETFFAHNKITLSNFNLLMRVFSQQGKLQEAREAMAKVKVRPI
jgi:hypothetical protein